MSDIQHNGGAVKGVRYIYEEVIKSRVTETATNHTAVMMADLPSELRKRLREAAYNLDISLTAKVIKKIRSNSPVTAHWLPVPAKSFRFGKILDLLRNKGKSDA